MILATTLLTTFLVWLGFTLIFTGIGSLFRRLWGMPQHATLDWLIDFWVGWSLSVAMLQIWHLFYRVNGYTLVVLALLAMFGFRGIVGRLRTGITSRFSLRHLAITVTTGAFAMLIANTAMQAFVGNDFALYHQQMVQWINAYPIVPGLANLHGRFGFNNSFFLYVALTNATPLGQIGTHIAGSLLVFQLLLVAIHCIYQMLWKKSTASWVFAGTFLLVLI
ncbi:MAG: hypothetical protein AAF787_25135, partial [Chloroflexota bacterium]